MNNAKAGWWNSAAGKAARVGFVLIFAAYAFVVLRAVNPPPFVDYPDWVYQGVLFQHVLSHHAVPGYVLKSYPVPNSFTTVGLGMLDCVLPWRWAGKIWICLYFVVASFATFQLSDALGLRSSSFKWILPGTIFLNLNFWYGHISFEFGLCVFLLFTAMLFQERKRGLGYGLVLIALFFIHMEACACGVLLFFCFCLERRRWKLLWQAAPVTALIIWYAAERYVGRHNGENTTAQSQYHYGGLGFFLFKAGTYFKTLGYINIAKLNGFSETEAVFGRPFLFFLVFLALLIGVTLLTLFIKVGRVSIRSGDSRRFSWIFLVLLLPLIVLLPQSMLGTSDPGARIILVALALGIFLSADREEKLMRITAVCSLALCLVNLVQFQKIEVKPHIKAVQESNLPSLIRKLAHVEPETRLHYYESLERNQMTEEIFPTGIFRRSIPTDDRRFSLSERAIDK